MKRTFTRADFQRWGAQGAKLRRHRKLSPEQARAMVKAREAKRKAK
jgi:hypothetical protein